MISTIVELEAYFASKVSPVYSREKYDRFLQAYPFTFTIHAIHLTGTNGKGSTATFLRNFYQSRFKKVGLFTSPALSRFQEMIYINQEEIRDDYILAFFKKWQPLFDQYELTAFEMQTLLAFHYFHDQGCDFAIIEVGMGGKIDATNIFTPVLSIITNISLEHRAYLGNTLASIADHKAGIIKPKVPVLVGPLPIEAMRVVEQVSQSLQSPLYHRQPYQVINANPPLSFQYGRYPPFTLSMSATYQFENAALALAAVDILKSRYPLKEDAIKHAIYQTFMPGRLEVVKQSPLIILDGAHNPGGIEALIKAMTHHDHRSLYVLFAAFKDKEIDPMLSQLRGLSKHIFITTFPHPRARKKGDYPGVNEPVIEDYEQAISVLTKGIPSNGVLLITGSLAFIGLVRQKLLK
jgi:dihydrofolate synthase/folylpolyglutamate synthase